MEGPIDKSGRVIPYDGVVDEHSLESVIPEGCVICGLVAEGLDGAIEQLLHRLFDSGYLRSFDECLVAVMERERKMSTKLGEGIYFPHARCGAVKQLVSSAALCKFSGDAELQVVVLTVAPEDGECPYMQYIGHIASRLYALKDKEQLRRFHSNVEFRKWLVER